MAKRVNISAARRDLPALFDRVTRDTRVKVVIQRRDTSSEAVLVSREYLDHLERGARQARLGSPFRLIGSGELLTPIEDAIAGVREAESREAAARLDQLPPRRRR